MQGDDIQKISIGDLYQQLVDEGRQIIYPDDRHELIYCPDIQVRVDENKFANLKFLSKHKTVKDLYKFSIKTIDNDLIEKSIIVTADHSCMVYRDNFFENVKAKNAALYDRVLIYDDEEDKELNGYIYKIENLGPTEDYVYDAEVDTPEHRLFVNDILIHNSVFINIGCMAAHYAKEWGVKDLSSMSDEQKTKFWYIVNDFVENGINKNIQKNIREALHTSEFTNIRYSLEYIADRGIYEAKKRYAVHKVIEDGMIEDTFKYTGIALKQATTPQPVKKFLKEIYIKSLTEPWNFHIFSRYLANAFEEFSALDINEIAFWKGYNKEKSVEGFLQLEKGAGVHVRAAEYYNMILDKAGLNDKYDKIQLGDKIRFVYVYPNNAYHVDCIAFKNQYPEEFLTMFKVNYEKMFEKLVLQQLDRYIQAHNFGKVKPFDQMETDIFEL